MKENNIKDKSIIKALMVVMKARFCKLSWKDRLRFVYFCMSFAMITGRVADEHCVILIGLAVNLLMAYEQVRKRKIIDILISEDDLNDKKEKEMEEMNIETLQGLFSGAVLNEPQIVIAQSGSQVTYKKMETIRGEKPKVSDEQVASAIEKSLTYFWAKSAWAVIYCACRDSLGMSENMTDFERYIKRLPFSRPLTHECPDGTIQKTLSNHPYMKMSIDKWRSNGAAQREVLLAENFLAELE